MLKFRRILVPVSKDTASEEALRMACLLARQSKAKIYVMYVIEVKRSLPLDAEIPLDNVEAEEVLSRAEDIAAEEDVQIETDLLQAREVATAIVDEAVGRGVDLVIMGTDYKKRFGFFRVSDTVYHVVRDAPCRIIVIQEPPREG